MVLFFSEIKRQINDLPAKIFMSNDAQSYYNAFKFVFQEAENRLLCSWHVKNSWIKNWCKIQDVEFREAMKKRLTSIYNELNEAAFEIQLDSFIDDLSADPLTKTFADYFVRHYSSRRREWAPCYRKGLHVNTNMHLENMHR